MQAHALYTSCARHLSDHYMRGVALSSSVAVAAGYQVAKDALGGVLSSEHLTLGKRKWKLRRGKEDNEGGPLLAPFQSFFWCTLKVILLGSSQIPIQTASTGTGKQYPCNRRDVLRPDQASGSAP